MKNKIKKTKVFVALSGGVDSSVATLLLKEQGYDVVGVYMKNWDPFGEGEMELSGQSGEVCLWKEDRKDAMRVATKLQIPFLTFDFSREYKEKVVEYMVREYTKGRTPNPDVMCNRYIKFDLFLKKARKMGADYIATGHYTRLRREFPISNFQFPNKSQIQNSKFQNNHNPPTGEYKLQIARDLKKDQSYFLWTLTQRQLKYCLFPIGDYRKSEVREMAKKRDLPNAGKKDSQGLCFVGKVDLFDFLMKFLKKKKGYKIKKGKIVTAEGKIIGEHRGIEFYTIGQRHGLDIGGGKPYYVVKKDAKKNTLIVAGGQEEEKKFYEKELVAEDVNWISGSVPKFPLKCKARIRYRQPLQEARIMNYESRIKNGFIIQFKEPQRAVSPGQSIVFYKRGVMLGGGIIKCGG